MLAMLGTEFSRLAVECKILSPTHSQAIPLSLLTKLPPKTALTSYEFGRLQKALCVITLVITFLEGCRG